MKNIFVTLSLGFLLGNAAHAMHRIESFKVTDMKKALIEVQNRELDLAGVDYDSKTIDIVNTNTTPIFLGGKKGVVQSQSFFRGPDAGYMNYEEVKEALYKLEETYGDIVELRVIGTTEEGRDILAIKISDNVSEDENEPVVFFNGMHHAREIMTTEVVIDTAEFIVSNYEKDSEISSWVNNFETWIVPMVNPDGNNHVWTKERLWRKNRRGGYGVDLNRNYSFNWNSCGGSSGSKNSDTYRGPKPASEPETKALMSLVSEIKPSIAISYHSYSELVLFPYGCRKLKSKDPGLREFGNELARAIPKDYGRGHYRAGTPYEILYQADGGDIDWMYGVHGIYAYVVELNSRRLGFQPAFKPWRDRTVAKLRNAWKLSYDKIASSSVDVNLGSDLYGKVSSVNVVNLSTNKLLKNVDLKNRNYANILVQQGMYQLEFVTQDGTILSSKKVIISNSKVTLKI